MTRQKSQDTQKRKGIVNVIRGLRKPKVVLDEAPVDGPRPRRSVRDAITEKFGTGAYDKVRSPSTQIAQALTAKPVYQGTVAQAVIARRRAANKRARGARRIHRQAAGR